MNPSEPHFHLPLYHDLVDVSCCVVGGGTTALRKTRWLVKAGASVVVVSPDLCAELQALHGVKSIRWVNNRFNPEHMPTDTRLIVSAVNDKAVHQQVHEYATNNAIDINCVDEPSLCTVIFPAIIERSAIVVSVSSMGSSPTLARVVRGWIEARLPPNLGKLAELAQALKSEVRSSISGVDARKVFWERLLQGPTAAKALSGDVQEAIQDGRTALAENAQQLAGSISLVGAGPGDPELITLKALRKLQEADVIFYDQLANADLLDYARRDAEMVYVGKQGPKPGDQPDRKDNRSHQQSTINQLIVDTAKAGKQVVRLKGGDPFIYGRGGEEMEAALDADIDVQVIPGITAAFGAASVAGIPLTYRNLSQSVRFITGHRVENETNTDWPELSRADQTLVVYMGLVGLRRIMTKLLENGADEKRPVVLIENATLFNERRIYADIGTLADEMDAIAASEIKISGPTIVVIGDVVSKALDFPS